VKTGEKYTGTIAFRFRQVLLYKVQYEPVELLPNVMKAEWDEGCIL
jgi:hypothetical protein